LASAGETVSDEVCGPAFPVCENAFVAAAIAKKVMQSPVEHMTEQTCFNFILHDGSDCEAGRTALDIGRGGSRSV
jgi:hypothetical protein